MIAKDQEITRTEEKLRVIEANSELKDIASKVDSLLRDVRYVTLQ